MNTKRMITFCLLLLSASALFAQEKAAAPSAYVSKLLKPVESLIDRNTFVIAHVDVTKMDVEKTATTLQSVLENIGETAKDNEEVSEQLEAMETDVDTLCEMATAQLDAGSEIGKVYIDTLKTLGVTDLYAVSNSRIMMTVPVQIVFVVAPEKKNDLKALLGLTEDRPDMHIQEKDNLLILCVILPTALKDGKKDVPGIEKELAKVKPSLRPELANALENCKSAPVQLVFAMDGALRGLLSIGLSAAPEPVNKVDAKTIIDGVHWVSLAANPMKLTFELTIQSTSPEAAQAFYDLVIELQDMQMEDMEDKGYSEEMIQQAKEMNSQLEEYYPQVSGDRILGTLNPDQLSEYFSVILPTLAQMLPLLMQMGDEM